MKIKNVVKRVVGPERLSLIKGQVCHYSYSALMKIKGQPKIEVQSNEWKINKIISGDANYFRGYYDLNYFSNDRKQFLCHCLQKSAKNSKQAVCMVGYFDMQKNKYCPIAKTQAWCWQQGSRLRWNPRNASQILYNDVDQESYCTRVFDLSEEKIVKTIPYALYDITPDTKKGFSLNYSRLQRLRPGYGYSFLEDKTEGNNAPEDDGLFSVDIESGNSTLMFSLRELAVKCDPDLKCEHYLNHISVGPDGKRMIFFHIYRGKGIIGWNVNLYSCNTDGSDLNLLESKDRASHYCWVDSGNMMITYHRNDGKEYYALLNVKSGKKKILAVRGLKTDGHPNPVNGTCSFVTDSYPMKYGMQNLYQFSKGDQEVTQVAKLYHDYRTRGEKRCDLHPSISLDGRYVSVDTTFKNGLRTVVIFERNM